MSACEKDADLISVPVLVEEANFAMSTGTIDHLSVGVTFVQLTPLIVHQSLNMLSLCESTTNVTTGGPVDLTCPPAAVVSQNLHSSRVFLLSGTRDTVVHQAVVDKTFEFYTKFVPRTNLLYVDTYVRVFSLGCICNPCHNSMRFIIDVTQLFSPLIACLAG